MPSPSSSSSLHSSPKPTTSPDMVLDHNSTSDDTSSTSMDCSHGTYPSIRGPQECRMDLSLKGTPMETTKVHASRVMVGVEHCSLDGIDKHNEKEKKKEEKQHDEEGKHDNDDDDNDLASEVHTISSSSRFEPKVPTSFHLQLARPAKPAHERLLRSKSGTIDTTDLHQYHVSFHQVEIRRYAMIPGDNPSCMIGIPVTIDWGYEELPPLDLDSFEQTRIPSRRRKLHDLILNYYQRHRIIAGIGYSKEVMERLEREVAKSRYEREVTKLLSPFSGVQRLLESTRRKYQRMMHQDIKIAKVKEDAKINELRRLDKLRIGRSAIQKQALSTGGCINIPMD